MRLNRLWMTSAMLLALGDCAASRQSPSTKSRTAPGGGFPVVVVLRDATPPSQRVAFVVADASAVREDGTEAPLDVAPPSSAPSDPAAPRTWLEGAVPQGHYTGVRLTIGSARRAAGASEPPLDLPESPITIAVPFAVSPRAGAVIHAELRSTAPEDEPERFDPVFAAAVPGKVAAGLLGVASVGGWEAAALFDKRSGELLSVLPAGRRPSGIAVDTVRSKAYVAVAGDDAVAVLDLLEGVVQERIDLRAGDEPLDVAVTPGGNILVVANSGSDTVGFVDANARIEIERVAVANRPVSLIVDRLGRRAFVVADRGSAVTVLDVAARSVAGALTTETGPILARFGGRNQEIVYVAHGASPYLTAHDAASFGTLSRVYVGLRTVAFEVDPRSGRLFVARAGSGKIEVFEPRSLLPADAIPIPGEVAYFAVESEGDALGVLVRDPPEVRTIGIVTRRVAARTGLGPAPSTLKFVEAR